MNKTNKQVYGPVAHRVCNPSAKRPVVGQCCSRELWAPVLTFHIKDVVVVRRVRWRLRIPLHSAWFSPFPHTCGIIVVGDECDG